MTFEQCQSDVVEIRRRQGTPCPLVKVHFGGSVYQGRLARTDSDQTRKRAVGSPFGVLVLEGLGLHRSPEIILQIAGIPENGLQSLDG